MVNTIYRLLRPVTVAFLWVLVACLQSALAGGQQDLQGAQNAYRAGQLEKAITLYERSLKDDALSSRDRAMVCYNLGNLYLKRAGSHQERVAHEKRAIDYYTLAVRYDPAYAKAYNNRGNIYKENGALSKARDDYAKAIAADPSYAAAWRNRSIIHEKQRRYAEAAGDVTQYLRLQPGDQSERNRLARLQVKIKDQEKARRLALHKAREGEAAMKARDYERAVTCFDAALGHSALDGHSLARTRANRGSCWYHLGHYAKAAQDYGAAIESDPSFAGAYRDRGTAYLKMKQYSLAIADLGKAIALEPGFAAAYYNRALAYWSLANWAKAREDMEHYARSAPGDRTARTILEKIKSRQAADY